MNELSVEPVSRVVGFGEVEEKRAIAQIQGQILMAKKFPRDLPSVRTNTLESCKSKKLSERSFYMYERGSGKNKTTIMGASIRLAEVLARHFQNLSFGVKEVAKHEDHSDLISYCWDLENNVFDSKEFTVSHYRYTKAKGNVLLTTDRDIYEQIANMGARRKRACILTVIPVELQDDAMEVCQGVIAKEITGSKSERINNMLDKFSDIDVTQEMIEIRYDTKIKNLSTRQFTELVGIYNTLKDGMQKRETFFTIPGGVQTGQEEKLDEKIKARNGDGIKPKKETAKEESLGDEAKEPPTD